MQILRREGSVFLFLSFEPQDKQCSANPNDGAIAKTRGLHVPSIYKRMIFAIEIRDGDTICIGRYHCMPFGCLGIIAKAEVDLWIDATTHRDRVIDDPSR